MLDCVPSSSLKAAGTRSSEVKYVVGRPQTAGRTDECFQSLESKVCFICDIGTDQSGCKRSSQLQGQVHELQKRQQDEKPYGRRGQSILNKSWPRLVKLKLLPKPALQKIPAAESLGRNKSFGDLNTEQ
jgi:hypothetical protein